MQAYKLPINHHLPEGKQYIDLDAPSQNNLSDKWGPQVLTMVNEELSILLKAMPSIREALTPCTVDGMETLCIPLRIL